MHSGNAAGTSTRAADAMQTIDYQTDPSRYRHWKIERDGDIAYLIMDVDQAGGLSVTTSSSSIPTTSASTSN